VSPYDAGLVYDCMEDFCLFLAGSSIDPVAFLLRTQAGGWQNVMCVGSQESEAGFLLLGLGFI